MKTVPSKLIALVIVAATLATLLACDLAQLAGTAPSKPTVSIGSPPHGANYPFGQEILVQAHATDTVGIVRIELWVDGTLVTLAQPATAQTQFAAVMRWTPTKAGASTLIVKAINTASAVSDPVAATINLIAPVAAAPTSAPTPLPTATAMPTVSASPTLLPTVPSTRAPTIAPTLTAMPQPTFSAISFSSAFNETTQTPINPSKVFPYGVKIIYAYWTYQSVTPHTNFEYTWYRNGARVDGSGERFIAAAGKAYQWLVYGFAPTTPLDPGNYQFVVQASGKTILSDTFVIQAPVNSNTLTVFFTIQNGSPTGYVIDKQGVRHTPPGYLTIAGFHVSAGDRVIIQTDQTRFSLLFDCSTTPQIYSPCDFSADTPTKLPGEIRKNKSGTAYLNISRADNWAGLRPGFEPQRYPADPVLRIVLGD